ENQKVALFFTGRNHAGENIGRLYGMRDNGRHPPIQMCDALSRNIPNELGVALLYFRCRYHFGHPVPQYLHIKRVWLFCIFTLPSLWGVFFVSFFRWVYLITRSFGFFCAGLEFVVAGTTPSA
ncbi:MAG: hypothetical protein VSS75_016410, partial [Candidatus Parabeggiatoa sp.]|nr:hypothetical protein [Candidatus Parabeggiatoa sp.]